VAAGLEAAGLEAAGLEAARLEVAVARAAAVDDEDEPDEHAASIPAAITVTGMANQVPRRDLVFLADVSTTIPIWPRAAERRFPMLDAHSYVARDANGLGRDAC
jgi:hypothetical protein